MRYDVYDSHRLKHMGWDMACLASGLATPEAVVEFIREWKYWEGYPIVKEYPCV